MIMVKRSQKEFTKTTLKMESGLNGMRVEKRSQRGVVKMVG